MMRGVRLVGAVTVAAAAVVGLVACQKATKVVVDNRCQTAIEVDTNDDADPVALGYKIHWKMVSSGEAVSTRNAPDPLRVLYVWVRSPGSAAVPEPLVFEPSELEVADHKAVVVIVGDLCPGQ
jgi:hypothetical protein